MGEMKKPSIQLEIQVVEVKSVIEVIQLKCIELEEK